MKTQEIEVRDIVSDFKVEKREDGKAIIEGYAVVFDQRSGNLGGYTEIIKDTAFKNTDFSDVAALKNHDPNQLLARSRGGKGTLSLEIDSKGLKYRFEVPDTTAGKNLLVELEREDIYGSSFAFRVAPGGSTWEEDEKTAGVTRYVTDISIIRDVGPVVYPAYEDTSVAKRSFEEWKKTKTAQEQKQEDEERSEGDAWRTQQASLRLRLLNKKSA